MSEEMALEVDNNPQTSFEEKFLGVRTKITKPDTSENEIDLDLEIVDDRPPEDQRPPPKQEASETVDSSDEDEELEGYSEKVKKRINKLRYQQHEERRQREAAEKMREEAVKVAQQYANQNKQYEDVIRRGEDMLVTQIKDRATLAVEQAKSQYKAAYDEGDTDKVISTQEALITAQAELREASNHEQDMQRRQAEYQQYMQHMQQNPQFAQQQAMQQQNMMPQQPQQQAEKPEVSAKAKMWSEENPWFGDDEHKDMTALAYGVHEKLVKNEGVDPNSDEYFETIDRTMRSRFPEYFGTESNEKEERSSQAKSRSPSMVVTPASRNNGSKPRKVKLTQTQVALAKRLGLTNEQYAKQLVEDMSNG
tara:strand:+ start:1017 stop:2111 length:1095 start_codon:yes stop_codon:yes gene_type:complete